MKITRWKYFPGDILTFTNEKMVGTIEKIYVSYPNLHADVKIGNKIMIDDGKMEVVVVKVEKNHDVKVEVTMGGIISSKKGSTCRIPKYRCLHSRKKT